MSYKYETDKDSKAYTPGAQARATFGYDRIIEGITVHWWGDPNNNPLFDNIVSYLCRQGGNTSAHYVATGTGRRVACIVAPGDVAWHSGSAWGNSRTIGIEIDPRGRPEDFDVAAELIADIRSAYGDVPLYWHNYFVPTTCPGVYQKLIDTLDRLSYTKFSHSTEWGMGGDITPKTPVAPPQPPQTPSTTPVSALFKLIVDGKQVAAYSTEANAYKGYVQYGRKGYVKLGSDDVTSSLVAKFTEPSPTTKNPDGSTLPDTGRPITEKDDYLDFLKENNGLLRQILAILQAFIAKFNNIFKG